MLIDLKISLYREIFKSISISVPLNVVKSCQINDIPTNVIKMNEDIFANFITDRLTTVLLMVNFLMN